MRCTQKISLDQLKLTQAEKYESVASGAREVRNNEA